MTNVDLSFLGTPEWAAFIDEAERQTHVQAGLGYYWKEFMAEASGTKAGPANPLNPVEPGGPGSSQTPGLPDADDPSAKAAIDGALAAYGLSGLGTWAWNQYLAGVPVEQILLDIRETPEYQKRFPAMKTLAQRGEAITEAEYINYEKGVKSLFKAAGIPAGFYDSPDDFDQFLTNSIGLPELESRVELARLAVYNSDPATIQAIQNFYNVGGRPASLVGDLTAWFLDETRAMPVIQNQFIAAQTSGAAVRSGYGALGRTEAERLAMLGIDPRQAEEGFGTLARMAELFTTLPGESEAGVSRAEGQAAMFENNAQARQKLERVAGRRRSEFGQGGGYTETQRGLGGIG